MTEILKESLDSRCPMSPIVEDVRLIKSKCHSIFWRPNLILSNDLWWVHWSTFLSFLKDSWNIDFTNTNEDLSEIQFLPVFWTDSTSDPVDMDLAFMDVPAKYMSLLAKKLYIRYINQYKDTSRDRIAFYTLCQEFFQAFDAILLTWVKECQNIEEWNKIRQPLLSILIHLSQVPTNIQAALTQTSNTTVHTYNVKDILSIFNSGESELSWLNQWIQENRGWYGRCPALKDKTLVETFNILFNIYWKCFFSE